MTRGTRAVFVAIAIIVLVFVATWIAYRGGVLLGGH
jgi:hypothetical protein